jgi:flagellar hook-associated protein 1 FlgK
MGGLSSALNIAKNALLAFQTATQVISHNISNVNNESYCRQKVVQTTYPPSLSAGGVIGSGVKIETIKRYFDNFLERNINLKKTEYGLFSAEESGMTILESLFNETQESGLSQVLRNFWKAWQNLANYPENLSARAQVVENGKLIAEAMKTKFEGLKDLVNQIGLKLKTIAERINKIAQEIADLNMQITAQEAGKHTANDLRDQRDKLIGELSQIASIQYFETKEGACNVILGKGLNLVTLNHTWKLEISGTDVYWVGSEGEKIPLTSKEVSSGELGGWLRLLEQLSDEYNYEYVSGNRIVLHGGNPISESDKLTDLGLSGTVSFTIQGEDHFGDEISKTITFDLDGTDSSATVRTLLDKIEELYDYTVEAYIKDGRLFIRDKFRGAGKLQFSISGPIDFGSFDDPAYQRRVTELNLAGKLKLFGEELIKAINELHNQGVGLTFFSGEVEGAYSANQYVKELPYFLDLKRDGFFYLWLKTPQGKIYPFKIELHLDKNSTLTDLVEQINNSIKQAWFGIENTEEEPPIKAFIRSGKLVFQAEDGYSFAFSNDTTGILLSTGINLFFVGTDPADFKVNPLLSEKPELISSGKMDVEAYRSENSFFGSFETSSAINPNQNFKVNHLFFKVYDSSGNLLQIPPEAFWQGTYSGDTLSQDVTIYFKDANGNTISTITLDAGTEISKLPQILNGSQGIKAEVDEENSVIIFRMEDNVPSGAVYFTVDTNSSGLTSLIYWDTDVSAYAISVDSTTDNLSTIKNRIDSLPFIRAYFNTENHLVIELEPGQTSVYGFEIGEQLESGADPTSSSDSFLVFLKNKEIYAPSFRWNASTSTETRFMSGLEHILKPKVYYGDASITPNSTVGYIVKFYNSEGNLISTATVSAPAGGTLTELITNFDNIAGIKAQIEGSKFYIWLDTSETGAPENASYFTIEADDDKASGLIKTSSGYIGLTAGELTAYLFDENGDPIDAFDTEDNVPDPFRIELTTEQNLFQIFQKINTSENRQYGLNAGLDREGKLVIKTTGLYQTKTFVLQDSYFIPGSNSEIQAFRLDQNTESYYILTDAEVDSSETFSAQNLTITLYDEDGNSYTTTLNFTSTTRLQEIINQINAIDIDGDGTSDFSADIDDAGKLYIKINDSDYKTFKISSTGNFVPFLYSRILRKPSKNSGLINNLQGYELKRGDNRTAQAIADVSSQTREALNYSTIEDYYASMVGEVGVAGKSVRDSKNFLDDLLRQLKALKESISGVSLDEEMTNLIKYQQAFIASSRILATVEEMFDALISAKR